jgi:hypothetical protein
MVVKTQCNGWEVTGLCVGSTNARRYFSKRIKSVELHMGDLQIQCKLTPDFWRGQAEIHDPRLCEWLKFKVCHDRSNRMTPIPMALEQFGMNSFKLLPTSVHASSAVPRGPRYSPAA